MMTRFRIHRSGYCFRHWPRGRLSPLEAFRCAALTIDAINEWFLWCGIMLAIIFCERPMGGRCRLKQRGH